MPNRLTPFAHWMLALTCIGLSACATSPEKSTSPRQRADSAASGAGDHSQPVPSDGIAPKPRGPKKSAPAQCKSFLKTIHECATKAGHEDLAPLLGELARCETGDKCTGNIHSKNGLYHGAFQFSPQTWKSACHPIFKAKGLNQCLPAKAVASDTQAPPHATAKHPRPKLKMTDTCCATICTAEIISQGGIGNWPHCGAKAKSITER